MCKAPKMPKPQAAIAPDYVRNPMLDGTRSAAGAYFAARLGRSSLRINLGGKARSTGPNAPGTPAPEPAPVGVNPYQNYTPAQRFGIAGARLVLSQR